MGVGKSTLARILLIKGVSTIEVDSLCHQILQSKDGKKIYQGLKVKKNENSASLRQKIFSNLSNQLFLEKSFLPLLKKTIQEKLKASEKEAKLNVVIFPLWPYVCYKPYLEFCHQLVLIKTNDEIQMNRILKRDNANEQTTKALLERFANWQKQIEDKADICFNNSSSFDELITFSEILLKGAVNESC